MQEWYPNSKVDFSDNGEFLYFSHTHNRYVNTLAEAGLLGFFSLLALLFGILIFLIRHASHSFKDKDNTVIWLIGFNALLATSVVGLFNTTLHHEHGLLTMLIVGLCCRYLASKKNEEDIEKNTKYHHTG